MTENQWQALIATRRQAEHAALEILRRALAAWEHGTLADVYRDLGAAGASCSKLVLT
jgi:hypothetical protein